MPENPRQKHPPIADLASAIMRARRRGRGNAMVPSSAFNVQPRHVKR
jgi:hypothetical protein